MAKFSEALPDTLQEGMRQVDADTWICGDCFADFQFEFALKLG